MVGPIRAGQGPCCFTPTLVSVLIDRDNNNNNNGFGFSRIFRTFVVVAVCCCVHRFVIKQREDGFFLIDLLSALWSIVITMYLSSDKKKISVVFFLLILGMSVLATTRSCIDLLAVDLLVLLLMNFGVESPEFLRTGFFFVCRGNSLGRKVS